MNGEITSVTESSLRTRARIVQSPERIKRTIANMGRTAIEDKRTVALQEAKARDLQPKIIALLNIEKVLLPCSRLPHKAVLNFHPGCPRMY